MDAVLGAFLGAFASNAAWIGTLLLVANRRAKLQREQAQAQVESYIGETLSQMQQHSHAAHARREVMN